MLKIILGPGYDQAYRDLVQNDSELKDHIAVIVELFKKNPNDTRLENHALTKKMEGRWAFSITDDIRIVYKWSNKTTARFLAIGPHIKVYRKNRPRKQSPKR